MELASLIEKEFLPFVIKPGRYTGNEYNVIRKNPGEISLRVALAFPEVYELGMSYVGFDILYHILNSQNDIWAERVYAPWFDAEEILRQKKIPLFSLESRTPLREFDWIGFTLQYELTYSNIVNMLDLAGIPLYARERNETFPLIIGGGPAASNPEPVADFFDAILIGDGEEAVLDICGVLQKAKESHRKKEDVLSQLAAIPGVYIPSFYRVEFDQFHEFQKIIPLSADVPARIQKRILPDLKSENYPLKPLVPLIEVTHDRLALEIMRGCTEGCRFCNAGMIYRPLRQRPVEDILDQTRRAIQYSGFNEVSLLSLNTSDYENLSWLMMKEKMLLSEEQVKFSFPSLRLDALSSEMIDFVQTVKKTGFTFAPEAGSQRIRNVINKNISESDILDTLRLVLENGWQLIKFYFMIGLPTEKEEDVLAIVDLIGKCKKIAGGYKNVKFNISISPFSPKPHTPFQWEKQELPIELDRKIRLLQERITDKQINLTWRDGYITSLETIFARGGRELAPIIVEAWKQGARFDGWNEGFNWERWEAVFHQHSIDWKKYLRPISLSLPLPWDHIDMGVSKTFLQDEKMRAYEGKVSADCKDYVCLGCGLQRKEFANLVDCYRKDSQSQMKPESEPSQAAIAGGPAQTVTYGRGAKRRQVSAPPVKKKIRLRYTKTGLTRFISHLDVIRVFDRAARRAKIPLVYSQGFNPRPRFSFGPPLSLGIASIAEYLDLETEIGRESDLQWKLNRELPPGMEIVNQKTIFARVPSLSASINTLVFETFLDGWEISDREIKQWLSASEIIVERVLAEGTKTLNIRPFIETMEVQDGKLVTVIKRIEDRMANITEVLDAFCKSLGKDYRRLLTQRSGQYIVEGERWLDPFQVIG
ncbi:MAG: TIGR03960 family B12-binding radical SAM protein [Calditrichia bacterium]